MSMDDRESPSIVPDLNQLQEQAANLTIIQSKLTADMQKSIDETNKLLRRISEGKSHPKAAPGSIPWAKDLSHSRP